jgi:predicted enzyme related to lactoylglutathione lyase
MCRSLLDTIDVPVGCAQEEPVEMPASDTERARAFFESAFGWQTTLLGPEADDFVLAFTRE